MKSKAKQPKYTKEPRDGLELTDTAQIMTRDEEKALGLQPPEGTAGLEWERTEGKNQVTLKPRRGGKRPGAGRKSKGHVRMQVLVSKSTRDKISRLARNRGVSMSAVVSDAFKE
ncbi:MAG: hypothetical protein O3C43_05750 [Verrucomicrobia bacterium]|nr:hypothetical protein [Verrucomicrobiota bacterium]MDA1065988.1 hypothetical protein [Verrucomicrobiota bacterium]